MKVQKLLSKYIIGKRSSLDNC